jgi:hypothetical protein
MTRVITHYICSPIPVRGADWPAYFDGCEEDGPYGHGATELDALEDLYWQVRTASEARAVAAKMARNK